MDFLETVGLERLWMHIVSRLEMKVDKIDGKGLSSNDYTTAEKEKLSGIHESASSVAFSQSATSGNKVGTITINGSETDLYAPVQTNVEGNAGTATKLATRREFQTNLGSSEPASFDGSANVTPGVSGTLGLANGGTGATSAEEGRANLGATKVFCSSVEPDNWTSNDMWLHIVQSN